MMLRFKDFINEGQVVPFNDRQGDLNRAAEQYKTNLIRNMAIVLKMEMHVTKDEVLAAIEAGYNVMKRTGDVNKAGSAVRDKLDAAHKKGYEKNTKLPWPANNNAPPVALGRRFMSGAKKKIATNDNARPKPKLVEATYQGKKVPLNKRLPGDVKKSKVFVDLDGDGKAQKVNFGDKNMTIKKDIPARRKSFRARHNCDNPGPKNKARYWSCKAW